MPKQFATAGPRSIYPTAASSRKLARCSVWSQLLFDRLIAAADDQGRLQGDPMLVKADCMPLVDKATARTIETWLKELDDEGLIQRYEGRGEPLIQITGWWEHQGGQRHIYPSRWPAPEGWTLDRVKGHGEGQPADDGGQRPPGGGQRTASASAVPVPKPVPVPMPAANGRLTDAYKAHTALTGEDPNANGRKMIDDLCHRFGREALIDAMYRVEDTSPYGFLARAKDILTGKVALHA